MKLLEIEGEGDLECMVFLQTNPNLHKLYEQAEKEGFFDIEQEDFLVTITAHEFEGLTKKAFAFFKDKWHDYDTAKDHDFFIIE